MTPARPARDIGAARRGTRRTTRTRRGFSLSELLVTMVILGLVGTAVAQMMMRQQRFFHRTNEQMLVRRELRKAMAMLPTDLRGVSSPGGDLSAISATAITFRGTFGQAFVCDKPSSSQVDVPPVNTARTTTTSWYTPPMPGDTIFALRHDSSGVDGDYWSAHRIVSIGESAAYCPGSPYTDGTLDAGKARTRFTVQPAFPDSVGRGSALRFTRSARYAITQASSGRWYIHRSELANGVWLASVPVAGPFVPPGLNGSGGLVFSYFDSTGTATLTPSRIARIDVQLRAQGNGGPGDGSTGIVRDSVSIDIAVRNRR